MKSFAISTTKDNQDAINAAIARWFHAKNIPFVANTLHRKYLGKRLTPSELKSVKIERPAELGSYMEFIGDDHEELISILV